MNVEKLQGDYNRLVLDLSATAQALSERDIELSTAGPMAAAAHTLCSVFLSPKTNGADLLVALGELLDVHRQQTPGPPDLTTGE